MCPGTAEMTLFITVVIRNGLMRGSTALLKTLVVTVLSKPVLIVEVAAMNLTPK